MPVMTFAEYLIDHCLPAGEKIHEQVNDKVLKKILINVAKNHPADYDSTVSKLKQLGDLFSTYEPASFGLDEISVPNKARRDLLVHEYKTKLKKVMDKPDARNKLLGEFQDKLMENDMHNTKDDASLMIRAAMGGKAGQLLKLRTTPGVVGDHDGNIVPDIFEKSYAEGVDPAHFWLNAAESRKNLAEGQVNTAKPGELSKIINNIMAPAVVSSRDCGTQRGILLAAKDDSIIDRYLGRDTVGIPRNTLITPDIQQKLLKKGIDRILVRSPQTCEAHEGTVCQMCMGLRPSTGKDYQIGDNAGIITAGNMGEPLTQMTLSAKHSTAKAGVFAGLRSESGFRQMIEMPKQYPNKKVLCEVPGRVWQILPAAQGGVNVIIQKTGMVPDRYIETGHVVEGNSTHIAYYIPPNLRLAEGIKRDTEVFPGKPLSTGNDNLKDIARLRNLGFVRSSAAENMYQIYKNSGQHLDRRHFELLSRQAHPYVKIIKSPKSAPFVPGEVITYQKLINDVKTMPKETVSTSQALGRVLGEGYLDMTVGTEVDAQVQHYLQDNNVHSVQVINDLEVAPETLPISRVVNRREDWVSSMNHRFLKDQIRDAASFGKRTNIHGYNPVAAYAYGTEMGAHEDGRY